MTALSALLAARPPEASRAPSIVVTVYGDAIVPRGGTVGLATLTTILGGLGIGDGAVRTAVSRLAADGWLERSRAGRNTFYRLTPKGEGVFARATEHIYDPPEPAWDGRLALFLPADPAGWREEGFGEAAPGLWTAPAAALPRRLPGAAIRLDGTGAPGDLAAVAARAWPLERLARDYAAFLLTFGPIEAMRPGGGSDGLDPLLVRILLVHDYRRIILRDPVLPSALLPADWPGFAARALCARLYRAVLPEAERWLDHHAVTETGPLPAAAPALAARFAKRYSKA